MSVEFLRGYLLAYAFWIGIPLGSIAIIMLHNLTGGAWGAAIRRYAEPAARTIPLFALLFLPIAFGVGELYVWARPDVVAHDELLRHKAAYLNVPFFLVRTAIYFAVWIWLAFTMTRRPSNPDREFKLAGPGLILYGLTMTFAAIDWIMSLDPHWFSTIFGLMIMVGQVLAAFAFAIAAGAITRTIPTEPLHDLGKLLLAFVMLWAYLSFSQWLIVWSGNLPEEIPWYLRRLAGGYEWVALALIVLHFALPFVLLLSRGVKRNPATLWKVAAFVLAMRIVDLYWLIAPSAGGGHGEAVDAKMHLGPLDVILPLVAGGVFVAAFRFTAGSWKSEATST